jgi:hypothetical protein
MTKLAYSIDEAAAEVGLSNGAIVNAIKNKVLISRLAPDGECLIAHYDLELWVLGFEDYLSGLDARRTAEQERRNREAANRAAKSAERREARAQRAAMKAAQIEDAKQLEADLAELARLRERAHN